MLDTFPTNRVKLVARKQETTDNLEQRSSIYLPTKSAILLITKKKVSESTAICS